MKIMGNQISGQIKLYLNCFAGFGSKRIAGAITNDDLKPSSFYLMWLLLIV